MGGQVITFDIETSSLGADMGFLICAGWRVLGQKKVHCPTIDQFPRFKQDPTDDRDLVQYVGSQLQNADILVGHYSSRFDFPFIQARLIYHRLPPLPPIPHVDTWRLARYKMALQSNGLDNVGRFLEAKGQKTPLNKSTWRRAQAGHRPSIRYIRQHCIADVKITEEAYTRLKVLSTNHPNLNLTDDRPSACPICTGGPLQRRGWNIARTSKKPRYQCVSCGGWSSGPPQASKAVRIR